MRVKIYLTSLLFVLLMYGHGQDTISTKKHLNELGLDATPLLKFYFNFGQNGSFIPTNYYLTYRRYFKKSNLRAAIGGNYSLSQTPSPYNGDTLHVIYTAKQTSLEFRLGYEFFQNISKRWQVFYGADIRTSYSHSKSDNNYSNGGYLNGSEIKYEAFGLAPILGVRFKVHKRISILTESSFLMQYSESSVRRYYIPVNNSYSPRPDDPKTTTKSFGTIFSYPVSLILTITI